MSVPIWERLGVEYLRAGVRPLDELRFVLEADASLSALASEMWRLAGQDSSIASQIAWSVDWARCGMPRVRVGHRLAASLMATVVPAEHCADLTFPWPAFAVDVPSGLLFGDDTRGHQSEFKWIHVRAAGDVVVLTCTAADAACWTTPARQLSELAEDIRTDDTMPFAERLTDLDARALHLATRLAVGVAIAMSSPDERERAEARRKKAKTSSPREEPTSWVYTLSRDVHVDVRQSVAAYLLGETRKAPISQWLTRGHWRRQPHGPNGSLRRWQHIEPYWNGTRGAPIAVRGHAL